MYFTVQSDANTSAFAGVYMSAARPGQIRLSRKTVPRAALASNKELLQRAAQLNYFILRRYE